MPDLVVGLGEIGNPILKLLKNRNFKVDGYDICIIKSKKFLNKESKYYEVIHICIPDSDDFVDKVIKYGRLTDFIIIHSTVEPGTTEKINSKAKARVIYSPIRGVHNDMYDQIEWFSKFYASNEREIKFEKRFPKCIRVDDSKKLENSKINQLKYYGLNIAFRKFIDSKSPMYWEFFIELHQKFGIYPIMYNDEKQISGHCILENMEKGGSDEITKFIKKWGKMD